MNQKKLLGAGFLVLCVFLSSGAGWFFASLSPAGLSEAPGQDFVIQPRQGLASIAADLRNQGLIRSAPAFRLYAFISGRASRLQPGSYQLSPSLSAAAISRSLALGPELETTVTLTEGMTAVDIDTALSAAGVIESGEFLRIARAENLEGRLFPDTYRFYFDSLPREVMNRFLENFENRAEPILSLDSENYETNLTLASILEKEVPDQEERKLVAGLLIKRVEAGMPLQVDASICYIKEVLNPDKPCEPITALDKQIASPYNTYLNSGWPPGPISNPGVLAIRAALEPVESDYWYYLSDPVTDKTIFSKTFEEHLENQLKYLRKN